MEQFGSKTLEAGLFRTSVRKYIDAMLTDWNVADYNKERAAEAVEFHYTWWAEPDNRTAQTQEFFNVRLKFTPIEPLENRHKRLGMGQLQIL